MIPRIIHWVWLGPPMPDRYEAYRRGWREHHADWEHRLWTEADLRWLTHQGIFDRAEDWCTDPERAHSMRSDIARHEILLRHGGIYVDCDVECLRAFDPLLDAQLLAGWEDGEWIGTAVLGAVPGHPAFGELVARLPARLDAVGKAPALVVTGPRYASPILARYVGQPGVTIHPPGVFYPYSYRDLRRVHGPFPDAYAVHHWGALTGAG